jgi:hypothetical protein
MHWGPCTQTHMHMLTSILSTSCAQLCILRVFLVFNYYFIIILLYYIIILHFIITVYPLYGYRLWPECSCLTIIPSCVVILLCHMDHAHSTHTHTRTRTYYLLSRHGFPLYKYRLWPEGSRVSKLPAGIIVLQCEGCPPPVGTIALVSASWRHPGGDPPVYGIFG